MARHGENSVPYHMPRVCPSCGAPVVHLQDEAALRCVNPECPAQSLRNLIHFASRTAMAIDGLGEAIAQQLIDRQLVHSVADLYDLTKDQLLTLDKFKAKSAENLLKAIASSKQNNLDKLVFGLGIRNIGDKAAALLAEHFGSMDALRNAAAENISSIDGFGGVMAQSVVEFFAKEGTTDLVHRLADAGVNMQGKGEPKGDKLAGTRIIPLVIEEEKMKAVRERTMELTGGKPILELKPFQHKQVGIVTTGNEVFHGRIKDTFTPVIVDKLSEFDTEVIDHVTWDDDDKKVTASILDMIGKGADVVICTGGMSVDPDDKTPLAIKNTGARIVSYGAPVLPGAMFLLAYYDRIEQGRNRRTVIMGLPGCVMYAKRTIFDLVLPRVMADDEVTPDELAALGMGGLCLNCPVCTFPNCGFGKGY